MIIRDTEINECQVVILGESCRVFKRLNEMLQKEWKPFCIKTHLQLIDPVDKAALPESILGNFIF